MDEIFIVRVGRNSIRPTNDYANGRMNRKMDKIFIIRIGRNSIRPTNDHANGRANRKIDRVSVRFYPGKGKMAGDSMVRHPRKGVWGCPILVVRFLDHMPGLHFEITVDYIDG